MENGIAEEILRVLQLGGDSVMINVVEVKMERNFMDLRNKGVQDLAID